MRNFEHRSAQRDEDPSRYERSRSGRESDERGAWRSGEETPDRGRERLGDDNERGVWRSDEPRRESDRWREAEASSRGREAFAERYGQRSVYSPDGPRRSDEASDSSDPYFGRYRGYDPLRGSGYDSGRYSGGSEARRGDVERGSQVDERYFGQGGQSYDLDRGGSDDRQSYRNRSGGRYGSQGEGSLSMESWAPGPYTGRGPKGYKRSDQQITEDACQRLERDGQVDASEIEVSADDGVLHLRGTVSDRESKRRAERCVESVYGARDVVNELRIS